MHRDSRRGKKVHSRCTHKKVMRHKETAGRKTSKKACLHLTGTHTHTHTHLGQIAPGTRRWCRCCRSRWIGQTQTLPPPLRSFLSVEPDADTMAVAPGTKHNTHRNTYTITNGKTVSLQPFSLYSSEPCDDKDEMPSQPSTHSYTNTQSQSILTDTQPRQLWAHIQTPTRIHVHAQPHTRAALNLQNMQSYARFIPLLEMYADNEAEAACNVLQLNLRWLFYATVLTFFCTYIYILFHNQWWLKLVRDKQRLTAIFPQPVRELEGRCQRAAGGENVEWSWTTIFCRGEFHWYWTFILIHLTDKKTQKTVRWQVWALFENHCFYWNYCNSENRTVYAQIGGALKTRKCHTGRPKGCCFCINKIITAYYILHFVLQKLVHNISR